MVEDVETTHYGTEWRPWPIQHDPDVCGPGCGAGYFSDYRSMFARVFDKRGRYLLVVSQHEAGHWVWEVGSFSWTPYGDLFDPNRYGKNATRRHAEAEARRAAETLVRQDEKFGAEFEAKYGRPLYEQTP